MKIFHISETCVCTGNTFEDFLHDCCLDECCLAAIQDTTRTLPAWTDYIYELLNRGLPPCPSQTDQVNHGIEKQAGGLCPFSLFCYKRFASAVLPSHQRRLFFNKIQALIIPEKQRLWAIHDVEAGVSGLENDIQEFLSQKPYYTREWERVFYLARIADTQYFARVLDQSVSERAPRQILLDLNDDRLHLLVDVINNFSSKNIINNRNLNAFLFAVARQRAILPSAYYLGGIQCIGPHPVSGGGFADVYKGLLHGQLVALKVPRIFDNNDADNLKELFREVTVWRSLKHKNVLPFYGINFDVFQPRVAMVSPWLANGHLRNFLKRKPGVNKFTIIKEVAEGLEYLHTVTAPVIHGDLRCANILVDDSGCPRISDFGLASIEIAITLASGRDSRQSKGATRWQAPELLQPSRFGLDKSVLTKQTDVYAFAMTCIEVMTEEVPFSNLCEGAMIMEVAVHDRRPLRPSVACMNGDVGFRLWSVIQDCWKTFPHERPDMSHIVEMLSRLFGTNVNAKSDNLGERTNELVDSDLFDFVQELATVRFDANDF